MTNANDFFGSSLGTTKYYKTKHPLVKYTDGVKELAENCGAYWLIDLILSYQGKANPILTSFQEWKLLRVLNDEFKVTCKDVYRNWKFEKKIPFSDFKYDIATLWLKDGCLLLPKEN